MFICDLLVIIILDEKFSDNINDSTHNISDIRESNTAAIDRD
jgi:hypothetical protein